MCPSLIYRGQPGLNLHHGPYGEEVTDAAGGVRESVDHPDLVPEGVPELEDGLDQVLGVGSCTDLA